MTAATGLLTSVPPSAVSNRERDSTGTGVGLIEQLHRMYRSRPLAGLNKSRANLHEAARISCRHHLRLRFPNAFELWLEHGPGDVGLEKIIDAGAAAALIDVREGHEVETGNRAQRDRKS